MKLYWLLPLSALLFSLAGCFTVKSNSHFTYNKVSPAQYAQLLHDSANHYLIDVRTPGEYNKAHISGAVNYNFFAFHYGRDVDTLQRGKTAFIYCHTCHRSPFAARIMKRKGFALVYDMAGGFANWANNNLPVVNK